MKVMLVLVLVSLVGCYEGTYEVMDARIAARTINNDINNPCPNGTKGVMQICK